MIKLFTKRNFIQKTIIAIITVILLTFCMPIRASADPGGILLSPIVDLFAFIGDVFLSACNMFFVDGQMAQDGGAFYELAMVSQDKFNSNKDTLYADSAYNEDGEMANPRVIAKEKINGLWGDGTKIPISMYSPQKIFSGQVPAFDVNFIKPDDFNGDTEMQSRSVAYQLHTAIARWYVALRNLAIVGLLIILLYVGIRIIISSTASDKAKWKEFLKDWLVALCILFTLHYIMTFTVTVVSSITDAIVGEEKNTNTIPVIVVEGDTVQGTQANMGTVDSINNVQGTVAFSFNTDIMGYARFLVQHDDFGTKLLYLIIYLAMVIFTIMFTFTYIKRSLTIAFLTIIAPLIALTYPIDKIGDGSAQGFNAWLKEYIYNILIQPFHLIIYTVFAGIAVVDLSATNPIYAILVLWFILQSEKLLRKFFGFEKASSAGSLASFAGGAATMKIAQSLMGKASAGASAVAKGGNVNIRQNTNPGIENSKGPDITKYALPDNKDNKKPEDKKRLSDEDREKLEKDREKELAEEEARLRQERIDNLNEELENADHNDMYLNKDEYAEKEEELQKLQQEQEENDRIRLQQEQEENEEKEEKEEKEQEDENIKEQQNIRTADNVRDTETKKKLKSPSKMRGVMKAAAYVGKPLAKTAIKTGARIGLGAASATIGVAAGIASGNDISDIIQYGATGATLGATMGYKAVENVATGVPRAARNLGLGVADAYREGAYGRNAAQLAAQRRELTGNKEWVADLDSAMPKADGTIRSKAERKELANKAVDYVEATGITDTKKLAKAMKLEGTISEDLKDVKGLTDEERATHARQKAQIAAQYVEKVDKGKLANEEYLETQVKSWTKAMTNPDQGVSAKQARKEAEKMMGYVSKLAKVSNKYN